MIVLLIKIGLFLLVLPLLVELAFIIGAVLIYILASPLIFLAWIHECFTKGRSNEYK